MKRHGGLLLEVTIAASVVGVALIGIAQLIVLTAKQERVLEHRRIAVQEAANVLELVLAKPWGEVTSERLAELTLNAELAKQLPDAKLQCELADTPGQPAGKKVTANISWRNFSKGRDQVSLTAWKFQQERLP